MLIALAFFVTTLALDSLFCRGARIPAQARLAAIALVIVLPTLAFAQRLGAIPEWALPAAALVTLLLLTALGAKRWDFRGVHRPSAAAICLLAAGGALAASVVVTEQTLTGIAQAMPAFLPLIVVGVLLVDRDELRAVNEAIACSLFALMLATILTTLVAPSEMRYAPQIDITGATSGRLIGPLTHPNALGTLALASAIYSLVILRGWRRVGGFVAATTSAVLTDQRGAVAALIVAILAHLSITLWRRKSGSSWWALTVVCLSFPMILWWASTGGLLAQVGERRSASVDDRTAIWTYTLESIDRYLPFGTSPQAFYEATVGFQFMTGFAHPHNLILTYIVMGGIAAGSAIVLFLILALRESTRSESLKFFPLVLAMLTLGAVESPTFGDVNFSLITTSVVSLLALSSPWSTHSIRTTFPLREPPTSNA